MADTDLPNSTDLILLQLKDAQARLERLEDGEKKSLFKTMTTSASASALFLGLVLTFASIYDAFVSKPKADRTARISAFNQAVNAAAKTRQDLMQFQMQATDPKIQLAIAGMATPQIANNISTARAILRDLDRDDVEIPQLIVLISEAFATGDLASAKAFVDRAVSQTTAPPFLRSEALRYEGKFNFLSGNPDLARKSFEASVSILGEFPETASARAYVLSDLAILEYQVGNCGSATTMLKRAAAIIGSPSVPPFVRQQLTESLKAQFVQWQNYHCPLPTDFPLIISD